MDLDGGLDEIHRIRGLINPKPRSWVYYFLSTCAIFKGFMIIICLGVIIIPIYLDRVVPRKRFWLIRRSHIASSRIPFLVPNRSLAVALFELTGSTLFFFHICIHYLATNHPEVTMTKILIWDAIGGLPSWLSIWLTGWSLLHTCQGPRPGSRKTFGRFPPPWAYNISWISGWILATVLVVFTCHKFQTMSGPIHVRVQDLDEMMVQRSKFHFDSSQFRTLSEEIQDGFQHFYVQMDNRRKIIMGWVGGCLTLGIVLVIFYTFILTLLVRKIRKVFRLCEAEHFTFVNQRCDQDLQTEKLKIVEKSRVPLQALRQELRLLMFFSFSVMMVLLAEVVVCAYRLWSLQRGHFSAFMVEFTLVAAMIPSVFISPVLLVQCWTGLRSNAPTLDPNEGHDHQQTGFTHGIEMGRINKGRYSNHMDPSNAEASKHDSMKFESQLPAFYQKLFWWYTNPDTSDIYCLHIQSNPPPMVLSTASLVSVEPQSSRLELKSIQLSEVVDSHHHY